MQPMGRRTFLKTAGTIAAGASLTGITGILATGCAPAVNTGVKKKLQFWAFSDTRTAWQMKAFDIYKQQKNPDFDIDWLILPYGQMHDKILVTSQAGSGGPDIADIEISQFSRFIKGNVIFADLGPKLQSMGALDNLFHPSATDPWTWQGKIYGMGNELNACLLSYRHDLWDKAGVKTPITTWDEFAQEAARYHQDTGKYLIDFPYADWSSWWMMTLQQQGGFFGSNGLPTLTSDASVKTLQYQQQALQSWARVRPDGQAYYTALAAGDITSLIGPSWDFSGSIQQNAPDTKGKWHLQPMPAWTAGSSRTATWGGTGVSVLKTSSSVDEAIDFVTFEHTTPEALLNDFHIRQVWPTFKPALADPVLSQALAFFDNQHVGDFIKEVSPEINKWYNSPYWPEVTDAMVRTCITPAVQNPKLGASDALNAAQNESMRIINFETA